MDSSDRLPKHLLIGFLLALAIYVLFFGADQWTRTRKGAWEVRFMTNQAGEAMIQVDQRSLGIRNLTITFSGEHPTNRMEAVRFDRPQKPIPFGKIKFEDLTYLPGSVAFDFFGHEVELLPRTLYINKQEHSWGPEAHYVLQAEEKLKPEMSYDPRKKKRSLFRPASERP